MIIVDICPETLPRGDHDRSGHLVELALKGYPQLAADTILNREMIGKLQSVVGNAIRRLNSEFIGETSSRERPYEVLVEIAFNIFGMESTRVRFSSLEKERTVQNIIETLKTWEKLEMAQSGTAAAARAVIGKILQEMRQVLIGRSMLARWQKASRRRYKKTT